jgi:hypothetical protein
MYAKPELRLVGHAAAVVLGGPPNPPNDNSGMNNSAGTLVLGLDE